MESINLDLMDKKILSLIETNGRMTYSDIAKQLNTSKQVIKYRMNKLERENIIQEYYAIINDSKLGKELYIIYFQLTDLTNEDEIELIQNLKKEKKIINYISTIGNWDFTIAILAQNINEVARILHENFKTINHKIKKKIITTQIEWSYFPTKILENKGQNITYTKIETKEKFDEIDLKIINKLTVKGRETLINIANKLSLSANTIKDRIKNLEKKKIIVGYKTKINYEKLGYFHTHFFVWATNINNDFYTKFKQFLIEDGRIESVSKFLGYSDIEFRCNLKSTKELYDFKRKLKNKFKDEIKEIELLIIVRSGISHLN